MKLPLLLTALAASTAQAQLNLYLENTQDLFSLCVAPTVTQPNPFFIGNNPSVIALSGDRLFVAGYNNTAAAANLRVVKIENIFGTRAFRLLNTNPDPLGAPVYDISVPGQRGFYGMSYAAGGGLIMNYDGGAVGVAGGYRVFDVDTQLNPILIGSSPAGLGARGGAGPSWDFGPTGQGYDYNNDGTLDGPLAAILDFAGYPGGVQAKGPFGILPVDSSVGLGDGLNMFAGRKYDGNSIDGGGNATAPVLNAIDGNGNRVQGTLWRDSDINPVNGNIAARASNDVVIGVRNALGGLSSLSVVDGSAGGDPYAFQIMQRCEWVTGLGNDVVVYNDYSAASSTVAGWTKAANVSGTSITVNMYNADGSAFTATAASGVLDYSYDPETGRLAICDFAGRRVFIFSTTPPAPACPWTTDGCFADYNNDGNGIDGDDVIAFFSAWDSSDICADVDNSGGVDGDDVINFFAAWDAGGVGFPGCE